MKQAQPRSSVGVRGQPCDIFDAQALGHAKGEHADLNTARARARTHTHTHTHTYTHSSLRTPSSWADEASRLCGLQVLHVLRGFPVNKEQIGCAILGSQLRHHSQRIPKQALDPVWR